MCCIKYICLLLVVSALILLSFFQKKLCCFVLSVMFVHWFYFCVHENHIYVIYRSFSFRSVFLLKIYHLLEVSSYQYRITNITKSFRHEPPVMAWDVSVLQIEPDVVTVCKPASIPVSIQQSLSHMLS